MKPDTPASALAYLRLVDVGQVSHPTGVELASSRGEGSCLLETNTRWISEFHLYIASGRRQFQTCLPCSGLSKGETPMTTNSLPTQSTQQKMPHLAPEQPAPASGRRMSRSSQQSRHPVPAGGADTSLIGQHRAADGRELQDLLRYTLNKLTPWLLSLSQKAKYTFPLGREQDEFQTNLLTKPITHPPNHPPKHLII